MLSPKISSANVFLALLDLDKPASAVDITDYLSGETGADTRVIATAVRNQLDQLVRKGCITKKNHFYMVVRDEKAIQERLKTADTRPLVKTFRLPSATTFNSKANNAAGGDTKDNNNSNSNINANSNSNSNRTSNNTINNRSSGNSLNISGCLSIAAIPPQIRRDNPNINSAMSETEMKHTQRFWKEPLFGNLL